MIWNAESSPPSSFTAEIATSIWAPYGMMPWKIHKTTLMNVPYHQGSFMFFRLECFKKVGLFDERFFMYPEDIDITAYVVSDVELSGRTVAC